MSGQKGDLIPPGRFIIDLHRIAKFAFARGGSFFLVNHFRFLWDYVDVWRCQRGEEALQEALDDLKGTGEEHLLMTRLLSTKRISLAGKAVAVIAALLLSLAVELPAQFLLSNVSSAWHVLKKGARVVPPLITAVVVVFVTSDAWRILGIGFKPRFFFLVGVFLLSSLLFLIRFTDYWEYDIDIGGAKNDIDAAKYKAGASRDEADLLKGIRRGMRGDRERRDRTDGPAGEEHGGQLDGRHVSRWQEFQRLIDRGADPVPLVKPTGLGARAAVYVSYVALSAFSLIIAALFVSGALMVVGLILINKRETIDLARSFHSYWTFGQVVLTQQLVSLCLSLGAFSAFFLVAAQHTEERKEFMQNVLVHLRRALLVYSVYYHARAQAKSWTGFDVERPDQEAREHDEQEISAVLDAAANERG